MSITYNKAHEICFWKEFYDPMFSWSDWGLIPLSRPYISTPKVNYTLTQIPNSSTLLNITDFMPGGMTYESRIGEWQFVIDYTHPRWIDNWYEGYYQIADFFHGAQMRVALHDDPTNIFEGRISVSAYEPGESYSTLTLSYDLDAMPLDTNDLRDMTFRVRFLTYNGIVLRNYSFLPYGEIPPEPEIINGSVIPPGAKGTGWTPSVGKTKYNVDYRPSFYTPFKVSSGTISGVVDSVAYSAHPIQYIIAEPEARTEEMYEVSDTVKFLFNNTNHSIDFLGDQGKTIKRVWYTPENVDIETNNTE